MEYFYLQNYIFNDTIYHTTEILKKTLNHGLYFITKLLSKLCMIISRKSTFFVCNKQL